MLLVPFFELFCMFENDYYRHGGGGGMVWVQQEVVAGQIIPATSTLLLEGLSSAISFILNHMPVAVGSTGSILQTMNRI